MKQTPFQTFRYVNDDEETGSTLCFVGSEEELSPVLNAVLVFLEELDEFPGSGSIGYTFTEFRRRDWPKGYAPKDQIKRDVFLLSLPSGVGLDFASLLYMADRGGKTALAAE